MYTKTQWVDNTTPIDKDNLNKIEQGIYDNSLVVDVIKDKLNPTDTETYKTAELTEGQITDVIGVNDIIIKGQTSQDGEPTPSAPVDVNVVSGSNVINISNKNLLSFLNIEKTDNGITYKISNGILKLSGTATGAIAINSPIFNLAAGTYVFTRNISGNLNGSWQTYIRDVTTGDSPLVTGSGNFTITETKQVQFRLFMNSGVNGTDITFYPMLEVGSTSTTYEPHQGKELPLDLGSIELCKIGNYQDYFYKFENDWYLHKEINKITSYNGETISTSYVSTTGKLSTGAKVYYVVNSTNTKITDTTLISQLEAIYNAPLYEETNITQTNNDLPMVLDITACKDNINGIKAFIRK